MKYYITPIAKLARYNIKIIFGNKFMYFILSAVGFYILTVGLNLISDSEITMATGYSMLLVPSILLIFYPTCFGIQNDQDAKIIEIIFGIPNYRYKIWLFRLLIAYMICFIITLLLAAVTDWLVVEVPPLQLALQSMVPALFIGLLCFMLSTLIRNGNGTAVMIIIIGLLLFASSKILDVSKWNVFLNPFDVPLDKNPQIFYNTLFDNRLIILLSSFIFLLEDFKDTKLGKVHLTYRVHTGEISTCIRDMFSHPQRGISSLPVRQPPFPIPNPSHFSVNWEYSVNVPKYLGSYIHIKRYKRRFIFLSIPIPGFVPSDRFAWNGPVKLSFTDRNSSLRSSDTGRLFGKS